MAASTKSLATCDELPIIEISLKPPLGVSVVGGTDVTSGKNKSGVFVLKISEEGSAFKDGRLKEGDKILEVNGKSLLAVTHDEALKIFRSTKKTLSLKVQHVSDTNNLTTMVGACAKSKGDQEATKAALSLLSPLKGETSVFIGPLRQDMRADTLAQNIFQLLNCVGVRSHEIAGISVSVKLGYAKVKLVPGIPSKQVFLETAFKDMGDIMNVFDLFKITDKPHKLQVQSGGKSPNTKHPYEQRVTRNKINTKTTKKEAEKEPKKKEAEIENKKKEVEKEIKREARPNIPRSKPNPPPIENTVFETRQILALPYCCILKHLLFEQDMCPACKEILDDKVCLRSVQEQVYETKIIGNKQLPWTKRTVLKKEMASSPRSPPENETSPSENDTAVKTKKQLAGSVKVLEQLKHEQIGQTKLDIKKKSGPSREADSSSSESHSLSPSYLRQEFKRLEEEDDSSSMDCAPNAPLSQLTASKRSRAPRMSMSDTADITNKSKNRCSDSEVNNPPSSNPNSLNDSAPTSGPAHSRGGKNRDKSGATSKSGADTPKRDSKTDTSNTVSLSTDKGAAPPVAAAPGTTDPLPSASAPAQGANTQPPPERSASYYANRPSMVDSQTATCDASSSFCLDRTFYFIDEVIDKHDKLILEDGAFIHEVPRRLNGILFDEKYCRRKFGMYICGLLNSGGGTLYIGVKLNEPSLVIDTQEQHSQEHLPKPEPKKQPKTEGATLKLQLVVEGFTAEAVKGTQLTPPLSEDKIRVKIDDAVIAITPHVDVREYTLNITPIMKLDGNLDRHKKLLEIRVGPNARHKGFYVFQHERFIFKENQLISDKSDGYTNRMPKPPQHLVCFLNNPKKEEVSEVPTQHRDTLAAPHLPLPAMPDTKIGK